MKRIHLTKEEIKMAAQWAADMSWIEQKQYSGDSEYLSYVQDILEHPIFCSMDRYIQHGHTSCKAHCIQVSYLSYRICKKYGWNARGAARAGLLHDLFLYDWHTHAKETGNYFHGYTHPRVAMKNAESYFLVTEAEKEMILRHMWPLTPIPPKTMAGMSIVYSDKLCSIAEMRDKVKTYFACGWRLKQL